MVIVLILVVVEDVLVHAKASVNPVLTTSLNPCCGGRCSSTEALVENTEFAVS